MKYMQYIVVGLLCLTPQLYGFCVGNVVQSTFGHNQRAIDDFFKRFRQQPEQQQQPLPEQQETVNSAQLEPLKTSLLRQIFCCCRNRRPSLKQQ